MPFLDRLGRKTSEIFASRARGSGSRAVARTMARDTLETGVVQRARKAVTDPAFEEAWARLQAHFKAKGKYEPAPRQLLETLAQARSFDDSLRVTRLARELAVGYAPQNRNALRQALEQTVAKAEGHDQAYTALAEVVRTRMDGYALFNLAEKRKIVENAVDRYIRVGGPPLEELARKALHVREVRARFDQRSAAAAVRKVLRLTTIEEQVRTIANFLNKALS